MQIRICGSISLWHRLYTCVLLSSIVLEYEKTGISGSPMNYRLDSRGGTAGVVFPPSLYVSQIEIYRLI